ncbi:DUF6088 family protein [Devosia sp. CAU 1758]
MKNFATWSTFRYSEAMSALNELKKHLRPGQVYRRADLLPWSKAVDRHLKQLVDEGVLHKLAGGVYAYPKRSRFGAVPAEDAKLVKAFLKDHRFLLTTPNAYNALGLGTTQLYNRTVVYNHKRHGRFRLGKREYEFRVKPHFPLKPSEEFLLVDLVDNVDQLAEQKSAMLDAARQKALKMDAKALGRTVREYGGSKARKFFEPVLEARQ